MLWVRKCVRSVNTPLARPTALPRVFMHSGILVQDVYALRWWISGVIWFRHLCHTSLNMTFESVYFRLAPNSSLISMGIMQHVAVLICMLPLTSRMINKPLRDQHVNRAVWTQQESGCYQNNESHTHNITWHRDTTLHYTAWCDITWHRTTSHNATLTYSAP